MGRGSQHRDLVLPAPQLTRLTTWSGATDPGLRSTSSSHPWRRPPKACWRGAVTTSSPASQMTTRLTTCPGSGTSPSKRNGRTEFQLGGGQGDGQTEGPTCPIPNPYPPQTKVLTGPSLTIPPWSSQAGSSSVCPSSTSCLQAPVVSSVTLLLLPVRWGRGSSPGLQSAVSLQVPSVFPSSGPGF